jgi:hypothetical protein
MNGDLICQLILLYPFIAHNAISSEYVEKLKLKQIFSKRGLLPNTAEESEEISSSISNGNDKDTGDGDGVLDSSTDDEVYANDGLERGDSADTDADDEEIEVEVESVILKTDTGY